MPISKWNRSERRKLLFHNIIFTCQISGINISMVKHLLEQLILTKMKDWHIRQENDFSRINMCYKYWHSISCVVIWPVTEFLTL
jgi:hypothetical protein